MISAIAIGIGAAPESPAFLARGRGSASKAISPALSAIR
jgi:hypothetical protein